MSTVGFLTAPLAFDFVRSWPVRLNDLDWSKANRLIAEMESEGERLLVDSGLEQYAIQHQRHVDMRYVGQGHQIPVPLEHEILDQAALEKLKGTFEQVYRQLYERSGPPVEIEIINWRVVSTGPKPDVHLQIPESSRAANVHECRKGRRKVWLPEQGGFLDVPVYDRYLMYSGMKFEGPAIVEERESTVVIGQGSLCYVDQNFNLRIDLEDPR